MMNVNVVTDIDVLKEMGCELAVIQKAEAWNTKWKAFLACPMGPHLAYGDPDPLWKRQDGPKVSLDWIAQNAQGSAPYTVLFEFGFLPVSTTRGGNVIAYHPETQAFYWAFHESFFHEKVMVPKTFELLPLDKQGLMRALVKLSDAECGFFLRDLRDGLYAAKLAELE